MPKEITMNIVANALLWLHIAAGTVALLTAVVALLMWCYAAYIAAQGSGQWVTLVIFGAIALALIVADAQYCRAAKVPRVQRIQRHLTNMLAATIATVTAVLVVNVSMEPVWIPWILPTIVITPLIVWWNIRVARQTARRRNA